MALPSSVFFWQGRLKFTVINDQPWWKVKPGSSGAVEGVEKAITVIVNVWLKIRMIVKNKTKFAFSGA